jgi:hypothetical protein
MTKSALSGKSVGIPSRLCIGRPIVGKAVESRESKCEEEDEVSNHHSRRVWELSEPIFEKRLVNERPMYVLSCSSLKD